MANKVETLPEMNQALTDDSQKQRTIAADSTKSTYILEGSQFIVKSEVELFQLNEEYTIHDLGSVYIQGVRYYDLKNINFINNTGIANLIELLKSLLKEEIEVQFVNVNEKIKNQIKSIGLDHILICD